MLEKIKEVPFIDESAAVKLTSVEGKLVLERYDKVIWAREETKLEVDTSINCYVEAEKFFVLFPNIKALEQGTCLTVTLKNGAVYELPFLDVSWETQEMPEEFNNTITFALDDLMLCTLKNLIKPELQCIYIDKEGAVSCNFISACISTAVKADEGFLLPPDVQALVNGRVCKVNVGEDKLYFRASDFSIITSKPVHEEEDWWESLRGMISEADKFTKATPLVDGMKRLGMFSDYVSFDGEKVISGENFEPFKFKNIEDRKYEIERLNRILTTAEEITEDNENLVFKNSNCKFLVSPMEDA